MVGLLYICGPLKFVIDTVYNATTGTSIVNNMYACNMYIHVCKLYVYLCLCHVHLGALYVRSGALYVHLHV